MNPKLKCIIVEDEPAAVKLLEAFAKKLPYLEHLSSFYDATSALDYLQNHDPDILITDIEMPGMSGLDLAKSPAAPPAIIFITAFRDFAPEGFDLNAIDYIVKPIRFDRFEKAINKARDFLHLRYSNPVPATSNEFLFIKVDDGHLKLSLSDIVYLNTHGDYTQIHTANNGIHTIRKPLINLKEKLPSSQFFQLHRSYIVNIQAIHLVYSSFVKLTDQTEIPISRTYKEELSRLIGMR